MGRHTSASRKLAPEIEIDIDEILAGIDNSGLNIISETPLGDVTVDGTPPVYTGIAKTSSYGTSLYYNGGAAIDATYIDGIHYVIPHNSTYVYRYTMSVSNTGVAIFTTLGASNVASRTLNGNLTASNTIRSITTDGTNIYLMDLLNNILKFSKNMVYISQYNYATLVPGFVGANGATSSSDNNNRNTDSDSITCDGNAIFVRTVYSLDQDTLVGTVIFKLTLDGTLIRNTVDDTDYYAMLDPGSNHTSGSSSTNRYYCSLKHYGSMTIYDQKIWMKFTRPEGSYAIRNYNLDFTPGSAYRANVYELYTDSSGYSSTRSSGTLVFDENGDIHVIGYRVRRYPLSSTDAVVRVTAPSIGLVAGVGDSIVVNTTTVKVIQVESENVVQTLSNINPIELTNTSISRLNSLTDKISLVKLSPITYAYRS